MASSAAGLDAITRLKAAVETTAILLRPWATALNARVRASSSGTSPNQLAWSKHQRQPLAELHRLQRDPDRAAENAEHAGRGGAQIKDPLARNKRSNRRLGEKNLCNLWTQGAIVGHGRDRGRTVLILQSGGFNGGTMLA